MRRPTGAVLNLTFVKAWWPRFAPFLNVHSRDTHWLGANLGLFVRTVLHPRTLRAVARTLF